MVMMRDGVLLDGDFVMVAPDDNHYHYVFEERYLNCWSSEMTVYRCSKISDKVQARIDAYEEELRQMEEEAADEALLVRAMDAAGYRYNSFDSYTGYLVFDGDCSRMTFESWQEVREWLEGVVFDDPDVAEQVERILASGNDDQQRIVEDLPCGCAPNQYLAKITWDEVTGTETSWSIKSAGELFSRIDMYDCFDEDLELWLLTDDGPLPVDWHGTWHDMNDPLKMTLTLRSTGNILDQGWGTDH